MLYTGLTVVGVATLSKDAPRLLGALVLGSGALGWINGLAIGPGGMLFYTENHAIWKMNSKGEASIVATIPAITNSL